MVWRSLPPDNSNGLSQDRRGTPMQTECRADLFGFERVEGRAVVAAFDGGKITSDAGALLLGATDRTIRLVDRFARQDAAPPAARRRKPSMR